jgi:hypothetical protein
MGLAGLRVVKPLGRGAHSFVYQVQCRKSGHFYVLFIKRRSRCTRKKKTTRQS